MSRNQYDWEPQYKHFKWFTVFVVKPNLNLAGSCIINGAGQHIAFDGKATKRQIEEMATNLLQECQEVMVFGSKTLGKLVLHLKDGGDK